MSASRACTSTQRLDDVKIVGYTQSTMIIDRRSVIEREAIRAAHMISRELTFTGRHRCRDEYDPWIIPVLSSDDGLPCARLIITVCESEETNRTNACTPILIEASWYPLT